MPVTLSYPGVYIEEVSSGVHAITGVATSIAAFVGYTRKGVPDKAVAITSFADFERSYGGLDRQSPLSYAVNQFFANGGTQAVIVRVASGANPAKWTLNDASPTAVLGLTAASPGAWGNNVRISIDWTDVRNADADFKLTVTQFQDDLKTVVAQEVHRNLSMDSSSPQYVGSVVNSASALIRAQRTPAPTFTQQGVALSADLSTLTYPLTPSDNAINVTLDGVTSYTLLPTSQHADSIKWDDMQHLVDAVTAAVNSSPLAALGLHAATSGADGTGAGNYLKFISTSATAGDSSSVVIGSGAFGGLANQIHMGLPNGGREIPGCAQHRPAIVTAAVPDTTTKGADGTPAGAAGLIGSEDDKTGIYALLDVDLFNLLAIPETFDMNADPAVASVISAAVDLCEKRRAFYIVDVPSGKATKNDILGWDFPQKSRNAALYFPAVRIADPLDGFRPRSMAPSGTLAGVYARTDANRGVWKAPAGTEATLNGVLDLATKVNDIENGMLNQQGINVLRSFPAYGRLAWGARTSKGSDQLADDYKYIPVRRLALFLEESLYRGTQWVVFEPNDEPLWAQIRLNLSAFMHNLFRQGAFQGVSPREAYFVKCDKETTTQNDIDLGIVNIVVGFAPLKPAEFVVIKLQQIAGQVQV